MPVKAFYLTGEGELQKNLSEDEISTAFQSNKGLLWADIVETTKEDGEFLKRVFPFHHLAVEACVGSRLQPPKLEDLGGYLFLILHGINYVPGSDVAETVELDLFIGPHFVVSNHNFFLRSIAATMERLEVDRRPMESGESFLAHAILDELIGSVLPAVDALTEKVTAIEDEIVAHPTHSSLETLLTLKKSILRLHRLMGPQRDIFNFLSRGDFEVIAVPARVYYRNIYDNLVSLQEFSNSLIDQVDSALQIYLSSVSNRQNEIMKVLSIVASIFMPLTLIAAQFSVNIRQSASISVVVNGGLIPSPMCGRW